MDEDWREWAYFSLSDEETVTGSPAKYVKPPARRRHSMLAAVRRRGGARRQDGPFPGGGIEGGEVPEAGTRWQKESHSMRISTVER